MYVLEYMYRYMYTFILGIIDPRVSSTHEYVSKSQNRQPCCAVNGEQGVLLCSTMLHCSVQLLLKSCIAKGDKSVVEMQSPVLSFVDLESSLVDTPPLLSSRAAA